jgi:hypothetical protein
MTTPDSSHDRPAPAATTADLSDCDVVMKGGITSGIVYPRLIVTLADKYRFRRIGGTSAGAIAATMTAAAEAGRRTETAGTAGRAMQQLGAIPDEIADHLHKLFQPAKNTESAFDVLMTSIRPGVSRPTKVAAVTLLIMRRALGWFLFVTALAMIPAVVMIALVVKPQSAFQWMLLCVILVLWLAR